MTRSRQATIGDPDRRQDGQGVAFGAPLDATGTPQAAIRGQIVILPGGVMLVDQGLREGLRSALGRIISGPIECANGRD